MGQEREEICARDPLFQHQNEGEPSLPDKTCTEDAEIALPLFHLPGELPDFSLESQVSHTGALVHASSALALPIVPGSTQLGTEVKCLAGAPGLGGRDLAAPDSRWQILR